MEGPQVSVWGQHCVTEPGRSAQHRGHGRICPIRSDVKRLVNKIFKTTTAVSSHSRDIEILSCRALFFILSISGCFYINNRKLSSQRRPSSCYCVSFFSRRQTEITPLLGLSLSGSRALVSFSLYSFPLCNHVWRAGGTCVMLWSVDQSLSPPRPFWPLVNDGCRLILAWCTVLSVNFRKTFCMVELCTVIHTWVLFNTVPAICIWMEKWSR